MCRPVTVAWTLVIERVPPVGRLTGMLLAEMSTCLKSLAASWVRNGKPSMLTDGLTGTPCDWKLLANAFSVIAAATRSPITSRMRITTTIKVAMTERRTRRRLGARRDRGGWDGGGPQWARGG